MMLKLTSKSQRTLGLLAAGLFTASLCAYAIDLADARGGGGRGGGGGGGRGGGGNHAHNFKRGGGGGGGHHGNRQHHHGNDNWHRNNNYYGRWGAGAVAVGATAAAVGSAAYYSSLPSGCGTVYSGGVKYWNCGGTRYQAQYYGSNIGYVPVR
jgi:hypothetical protein